MKLGQHAVLLIGALALGVVTNVWAVEGTTGLQSEVDALKARISEMEKTQQQSWLTERRAEEVKNLVREVLSDAETRSSLLESGMYAGHNGANFFLKSADGGFLMNVGGLIQSRYVSNDRDDSGADDDENGFEIPRAKIHFSGNIADPRITYSLRLNVASNNNNVIAEEILLGYQLTDTISAWIGETKAPFLREELTAPSHQQAVERSSINEIFTAGYIQGIGLTWDLHDQVKVAAALSDGAGSGESANQLFDQDAVDYALTARVDVLLAGDWGQQADFSAWSGEEMAVFVGAAVHDEDGESGGADIDSDSWTVDGSIEYNGLSLYAAYVEADVDGVAATPSGTVVQAGYNIPVGENSLEPFVRWEQFDPDVDGVDETELLTIGANYYLDGHNAKFTLDVVMAQDPIPAGNSVTNLLADAAGEDDQTVLRAQFQLLF